MNRVFQRQNAEQSFLMELSDSALRLKRKEEGCTLSCVDARKLRWFQLRASGSGQARLEEINDPIYRQVPLEGVAFSFLSALRAPAATLDSSGLTEESADPDDLNPESLRHVSEGLQVVPGAFSLNGVFYFEMWLVSDFLFSALSSLVWFL